MWAFAADRLHWHPGQSGKGFVTTDDSIHTWPINEFGEPHHGSYYQHSSEQSQPNFLFYIDPDGGVHDGGVGWKNQIHRPVEHTLGMIQAADERLYAADTDKEEPDWELPPQDGGSKPQGGPDYNFILNSAEGFHHHPITGLPCRCNFGHKRFGHNTYRTAGVEWNRFTKKQLGKKFMARPGAQEYIDTMNRYLNEHDPNEYIDPLVPFLNKEFKAGRIRGSRIATPFREDTDYEPALRWGDGGDQGPRLSWDRLHEWGQWNAARQHPTRRGVNILDPEFQTEHIDNAARQFREQEALRQQREEYADQLADAGETVHEWPDKWHIKDLTQGPNHHDHNMELEGEVMNHCIGNDDEHPFTGYGYKSAVSNGDISHVYSLRDPHGMPHATFHTNAGSGNLAEINGHSNHSLNDEYNKRVAEFLDEAGHNYSEHNGRVSGYGNEFENPNEEEDPYEEEPITYNQYYEMPPAERWDDYRSWNVNGDYGNDIDDEYYDAMNNDQDPEVQVPEPNYDKLVDEMVEEDAPWHHDLTRVPNEFVKHDQEAWDDYKQELRDKVDEMAAHDLNHLHGLADSAEEYTNLHGPYKTPYEDVVEEPWAQFEPHQFQQGDPTGPDSINNAPEGHLFDPGESPNYALGYTNWQAQQELLNAINRHRDKDGAIRSPEWVSGQGYLPRGEAEAIRQGQPGKHPPLFRPNDGPPYGTESEEGWKYPQWTYPDIPQEDEATRNGPLPYMAPDDKRLDDLRQQQHHDTGYQRAQEALNNGVYGLNQIRQQVHPQPRGYGDDPGAMSRENGMFAGYKDWWQQNKNPMTQKMYTQMQNGTNPQHVWDMYGIPRRPEDPGPHFLPAIDAWEQAANAHEYERDVGVEPDYAWRTNPSGERCPMCKNESLESPGSAVINSDGSLGTVPSNTRKCPGCGWSGESGAGLEGTIGPPQPAGDWPPYRSSSVDEEAPSDSATMLEEWLKDLGEAEMAASPSIHHQSPEDLDYRPAVSPDPTAAYYPPGHEPKTANSQVAWHGEPGVDYDHSLYFDPNQNVLHVGDSGYQHEDILKSMGRKDAWDDADLQPGAIMGNGFYWYGSPEHEQAAMAAVQQHFPHITGPGEDPNFKIADSQMPSTGDPLINLTPRNTPAWEGLTDNSERVIECPKCHKRHPVGECVYDDPTVPNQDYQQMKRHWKNHDPNGENSPIGGDGAYATSSYDENGEWQVKDEDWANYEPNYNIPFNMLQAATQELARYLTYNPQEQQDTDLLLNMVRRIMTDAGVHPSELKQQDIFGVVNNAINLVGGDQPIHGEGSPDVYTQHTWPLFEQPEQQNWQQFPEGLTDQIPEWGEQPPAYWDDPRFPGKMRRTKNSLDKVAARFGLEIRDEQANTAA